MAKMKCGHDEDNRIEVNHDGFDCDACYEKYIWESEAPLREVESGRALEKHLDYLSSFDDPRSF